MHRESPPHPARCGPCDDCAEFLGERRAVRDPWISYGISPASNPTFQRTGRGTMFLAPHRVQSHTGAMPHLVITHEDGSLSIPSLPTTVKALLSHAKRFGPEGVAEAALGALPTKEATAVETATSRKLPRRRQTTLKLRDQVRALHERGMIPAAIADALNVSDRRVKEILARLPSAVGRQTRDTRPGNGLNKRVGVRIKQEAEEQVTLDHSEAPRAAQRRPQSDNEATSRASTA